MPTPTTYFNAREHQVCFVARMVEAKYTRGVANHAEFMDRLVGYQRMRDIVGRATIKEGYGV